MSIKSIYDNGFVRVAACNFPVSLAQPCENGKRLIEVVAECVRRSVMIAVFPELCITGYSIEDIVSQDIVLDQAKQAVCNVASASRDLPIVLVVGAPLMNEGTIFNAAVVIFWGNFGVRPFERTASRCGIDRELSVLILEHRGAEVTQR